MPTYNGATHLPAALDSIVRQQDNDIEVIAVDDGSSDGTLWILEAYAHRLPLQIVRQEHLGNWVANTNVGLSLARGQWVCFLHQDDVWCKNRLSNLREFISGSTKTSVVVHPSWYIDYQGQRLGLWRCPLPARKGFLDRRLILKRLLVQNFIALPAPIFQRQLAQEVGGLQEELWYTADWDFWLRLASVGRAGYLATPLTCFRIHALSQTTQRTARSADMRRQLRLVLEKHLAEDAFHDADAAEVRDVARFSAEMNVWLASCAHGRRDNWLPLMADFLTLGPAGWHRFVRDSRLGERLSARIRAGLRDRSRPSTRQETAA
jgi:GT2 family glycosyltransferase